MRNQHVRVRANLSERVQLPRFHRGAFLMRSRICIIRRFTKRFAIQDGSQFRLGDCLGIWSPCVLAFVAGLWES
jgi:hypothetical protein